MAILKEVVAVTGKYTDKNGVEKSRYTNLGVIMETKNGSMMKLESIPVGWDGWAYLNDPRPRDDGGTGTAAQNQRAQQNQDAPVSNFEDDSSIPF